MWVLKTCLSKPSPSHTALPGRSLDSPGKAGICQVHMGLLPCPSPALSSCIQHCNSAFNSLPALRFVQNHTVLMFDNPGQGYTSDPKLGSLTIAQMADATMGLLRAAGLVGDGRKQVLLGWCAAAAFGSRRLLPHSLLWTQARQRRAMGGRSGLPLGCVVR
jgi:pimeloyl-ACP methyl ester carboxylesterase